MEGYPMAKDLVCGMEISEQQATDRRLTSEYRGRTYYFCSPGCKRKFDESPEQYLGEQTGQR